MYLREPLSELRAVCAKIDAAWLSTGGGLESFPDIVSEHSLHLDVSPFGVLKDVVTLLDDPNVAAAQQLSSFSDLYLRLFDNGRFWVEILNWWGSDINIHDHDFSGVQFQLKGEAFNLLYALDTSDIVEGVAVGDVKLVNAERWVVGARSVVLPGRQAPHNVCHIGMPTVSMLVRTHPRAGYGPQWNYFPPGVAASYGVADVCFRKRVGALRLLARGGEEAEFHEAFRAYVQDLELNQILFVLIKMFDILFEQQHVSLVLELGASQRPYVSEVIRAVASHKAAEVIKATRWNASVGAEESEVLALLGSSFSPESAQLAMKKCGKDQSDANISRVISDATSGLAANERVRVLNALRALGMNRWTEGVGQSAPAIAGVAQ